MYRSTKVWKTGYAVLQNHSQMGGLWLYFIYIKHDCSLRAWWCQTKLHSWVGNEGAWRKWYDENEPESVPIPDYDERINMDRTDGFRLLDTGQLEAKAADWEAPWP